MEGVAPGTLASIYCFHQDRKNFFALKARNKTQYAAFCGKTRSSFFFCRNYGKKILHQQIHKSWRIQLRTFPILTYINEKSGIQASVIS